MIYGKVNDFLQQIGGALPGPNWRIVPEERPGVNYKCEAIDDVNGKWVEFTLPKIWDNGLSFMEEFTPDQVMAIFTRAQTQVETSVWVTTMAAASTISNQDDRTIAGMVWLLNEGLIDQETYDRIMG
jgi:hypothetical protein